ncbi:acetyl-CoA carboxylase biotin carboxyl carrier protein [Deinococcus irradiatisoli]|uniref:Biotin carboxyl carrier protein of acetyl-CoA carboxylase n=1 Tax=Deinococcus irradiatisoli TaxID=2202254 RepID=A0A2Z3JEV5_9DEIO|nr:acetyl-CoA carboxylase biotin carboxyl carrier protein [Deinococcus irradiatisoli]AWN23727.1 acetyl-CoA carboxylase biotin carboxyl carrier protein [Deinococcus irradiatisoli]
MNPEDLKKILDALSAADVREFALKTGEFDLSLRRGPQAMQGGGASLPAASAAPSAPQPSTPAAASAAAPAPATPAAPQPSASTPAPAETPAATSPAPAAATGTPLKAPIVGTFYASSSPDAPPYVKVGDRVEAGQVLCIIEAMKLMNEIEAETAGVVREILVKNAEPVEYGQTLFLIE